MPDETKPENEKTTRVNRLVEILVREVSLVDRGANREKWLVRKRADMAGDTSKDGSDKATDDGKQRACKLSLPAAVKSGAMEMLSSASSRLADVIKKVKEAPASEAPASSPLPEDLLAEVKTVSSTIRGVLSKYPSTAKACTEKSEIQKIFACVTAVSKSEDTPTEKARRMLWDAMTAIDQGALKTDEEKAVTDQVVSILREAVSKADGPVAGAAKDKIVAVLETVAGRLAKVISDVNGATETSEDLPQPIPEEMGTEIADLADMLDGLVVNYLSPKSASQGEQKKVEEKMDSKEKLSQALSKLVPGQPVDEETIKAIKSAVDEMVAKTAPPATNQTEQSTETQSKETTEKAGVKMSADRRKRFHDAIGALKAIFDEVSPAEKGSWPTRSTTKAAVEKAASESRESQVVSLEKRAQEAQALVEKAQRDLATVREELAAEMRRTTPSNVHPVEKTAGEGDSAPASGETVWPSDMNAKDDF